MKRHNNYQEQPSRPNIVWTYLKQGRLIAALREFRATVMRRFYYEPRRKRGWGLSDEDIQSLIEADILIKKNDGTFDLSETYMKRLMYKVNELGIGNPQPEAYEKSIKRRYRMKVYLALFLFVMGMLWAFGKILSALH